MKFVVDASVAIKWFIPEIHSAAAERLLSDSRAIFLAPDLILPEFANVLWKKERRNEITQNEALEILAGLETLGLDVHPSQGLVGSAFEIASRLDRSVYDCLYLALAVAQDCPFVTADRKFHSVIAATLFHEHIRWVEEE